MRNNDKQQWPIIDRRRSRPYGLFRGAASFAVAFAVRAALARGARQAAERKETAREAQHRRQHDAHHHAVVGLVMHDPHLQAKTHLSDTVDDDGDDARDNWGT